MVSNIKIDRKPVRDVVFYDSTGAKQLHLTDTHIQINDLAGTLMVHDPKKKMMVPHGTFKKVEAFGENGVRFETDKGTFQVGHYHRQVVRVDHQVCESGGCTGAVGRHLKPRP